MPKLINAIHVFNAVKGSSARYGVGYGTLLRRFAYLYRRRFSPYEIYSNDLLNPRISDEALEKCMSREEGIAFDRKHVLDTYLCMTSDKAVFYALCQAAGVPVPRLLAVFDRPAGWTPDGRVLASQSDWCAFMQSLPQDFIVKPALGLQGKGVTAFRREEGGFRDHGGHPRTADEVFEFLCHQEEQNRFATGYSHHSLRLHGHSNKCIIQERLYAHPEIAQLTGSIALSTCRLMTHMDRFDEIHILATGIKVINGDNIADNFDKGATRNLWCSVDLETGQITEAFAMIANGDMLERVKQHPTTGRDVVGFRIPRWRETVEMARHLASVFRPQSPIHWDIGVTAAGPMVIEGNVGGGVLPAPLNRPVQSLFAQD